MSEPTPRDQVARLVTGYWVSQAVHVAAELGLADRLVAGPRTAGELAEVSGTHAPSLYRLLRALAGVRLFTEGDDRRSSLTPLGDCLRSDVPGSQRATARMVVGLFYEAWGDLLGSVRTGRPAFPERHGHSFFEHLAAHPEQGRLFDDAMTAFNDRKTTAMPEAYAFRGSVSWPTSAGATAARS